MLQQHHHHRHRHHHCVMCALAALRPLHGAVEKAVAAALVGSPLPGVCVVASFRDRRPLYWTVGASRAPRWAEYNNSGQAAVAGAGLREDGDDESSLGAPVAKGTVFQAGSLATLFVALRVMQLVEQEDALLGLDTPLVQCMPDPPRFRGRQGARAAERITLRHLLTHTSGIGEVQSWRDYLPRTHAQLHERLAVGSEEEEPLVYAQLYGGGARAIKVSHMPGEVFHKSPHNFALLAALLEQLEGRSIHASVQEHILDVCRMRQTSTSMGVPTLSGDGGGSGGGGSGGGGVRASEFFMRPRLGMTPLRERSLPGMEGVSSCFTSGWDLAKLMGNLLREDSRVVKNATLREMIGRQCEVNDFLTARGLGFASQRVSVHRHDEARTHDDVFLVDAGFLSCGQGSVWGGYQSSFLLMPSLGIGVAVLANAGSHSYEAASISAGVFKTILAHGGYTLGTAGDARTAHFHYSMRSRLRTEQQRLQQQQLRLQAERQHRQRKRVHAEALGAMPATVSAEGEPEAVAGTGAGTSAGSGAAVAAAPATPAPAPGVKSFADIATSLEVESRGARITRTRSFVAGLATAWLRSDKSAEPTAMVTPEQHHQLVAEGLPHALRFEKHAGLTQLDEEHQAELARCVGHRPNFHSPTLWPKLVGYYQLPPSQLFSPHLMGLTGGEVQVAVHRGELVLRAVIGPFKGDTPIVPVDPSSPLNFSVSGVPKLVMNTPVRGTTDLTFEIENGAVTKLRMGSLVTFHRRPWWLSIRNLFLSLSAWMGYVVVGRGRFFDVLGAMIY